jgi:hypothetical protein
MTALIVLLVILALVIGGIGLAIKGLAWLLIIALVLLVVGAVSGMLARGRAA